jgi:hypothetical protein
LFSEVPYQLRAANGGYGIGITNNIALSKYYLFIHLIWKIERKGKIEEVRNLSENNELQWLFMLRSVTDDYLYIN